MACVNGPPVQIIARIRGADRAIVSLQVESVAVVLTVFRPERSFQQNCQFQHQSRFIPPGSYDTRFISSITMSMSLIPQLKQVKLQSQEPLTVINLWYFSTLLQEFLLLGTFITSLEMCSALSNSKSSCLSGFRCTNRDCLRIFPQSRHKTSITKVTTAQT